MSSQPGSTADDGGCSIAAARQFTSRWARRRLQYGFIADPPGAMISTWAWGTEPSELPLSPIQPIC